MESQARGASRLEVGSEDGGGTDTEEDVLRQGAGTVGGSRGGLASLGDAGAVGGRGSAASLGHGGGSEDSDDSSSTHFEGCLWWFGGFRFWLVFGKRVWRVLTNGIVRLWVDGKKEEGKKTKADNESSGSLYISVWMG